MLTKLEKLSSNVNKIFQKNLSDTQSSQLESYISLIEKLTDNNILTVSEVEISQIIEILELFPIKQASEIDTSNFSKILQALDIKNNQEQELTNLSQNLKALNINIWDTDVKTVQKVSELAIKLDTKLTQEIAQDKKEKIIKINEYLGDNCHINDLDKITELAKVLDRKSLTELSIEDFEAIKLIASHLKIDITHTHILEISSIAEILTAYDIKSAESQQSTISKIWSGKDKGITDKLDEVTEIFKNFGYDSLDKIKGQEKVKFTNLLNLYKKPGFEDISKEVSGNIN